jgi:hypothetical protein
LRFTKKHILKAISLAAQPIEHWMLKKRFNASPPIIIVGPARSGTTLIYQALTTSMSVAYLPQFVTLFPATSVLAAALWKRYYIKKDHANNFNSHYGKSDGLNGISQGHEIWSMWFKWNAPSASLLDKAARSFSQTIIGQSYYLGSPLAVKWPGFSAHLKEIVRLLPNAFFVFTDRGTEPMARSIYQGRIDLTGDPSKPISRSPDGRHLNPDCDPVTDILGYIEAVRKEIGSVCQILTTEQYQVVKYEDFCANPQTIVGVIYSKYEFWGKTTINFNKELPKSFNPSPGPHLPESVENQLKNNIRNR